MAGSRLHSDLQEVNSLRFFYYTILYNHNSITTHGISLMTHTGNELTKILLSSCLGPDGAQSGLYDIRPVITNPRKVDDSELAPSHSEPSICVLVSTESAWNLIWSVDKTSEEFSNRNRSCSLVNLDYRDSQEQQFDLQQATQKYTNLVFIAQQVYSFCWDVTVHRRGRKWQILVIVKIPSIVCLDITDPVLVRQGPVACHSHKLP